MSKRNKEKARKSKREIFKKPKSFEKPRTVRIIYAVMELIVIATLIDQFRMENYHNSFICLLTLALFNIPMIADKKFNIKLPNAMEITIVLFIFAAEILGEIQSFYTRFPYWDAMLHTMNGFLMSAVGFTMIDILNNNPKIHMNMSPFFVAFVSFCFSMTTGVVWEFFEFAMDHFFLTDMQKDAFAGAVSSVALNPSGLNDPVIIRDISSVVINGVKDGVRGAYEYTGGYLDVGIADTMKDLIVNCIGAVVFSAIGFVYIKKRSKNKIAQSFIPQLKAPQPENK